MADKKTVQTAIRLDGGMLNDADALAIKLSRRSLKLTRSDILRMAIEAGLKELRQKSTMKAT